MIDRVTAMLVGAALLLALAGAAGAQSIPPQAGALNDYAHILDSQAVFDIARLTEQLRAETQAELVFVTLRTSGGVETNEYADRIRTRWGLGGVDGENHPVVLVLYVVQDGSFGISYNDVARPYLPHGALDYAFDLARPELEAGRPGAGVRLLMRALGQLLGA